ncbi:hypothetical protein [Amycolatopsis sp.]|uniref:hypothetical protein n=1 Tax=Amycolatopsis sp. TaxID=37632 RepID=UPI002D80C786|nr:hypothetical protein [Amycolatopsis sp.]HET6707777.1 hypothetical protein [Amycolatopsis sp.]
MAGSSRVQVLVLMLGFGLCAGTAPPALSGAAVFATASWSRTRPPIGYSDAGTSGSR